MIKKPSECILELLGPEIDFIYMRLQSSMFNIIDLVEKDNRFKGFYNPKTDKIFKTDNVSDFKEFQALIKGLNNFIYYNSLILSGYSILEHSLKSICYFISEYFQNYKKFEDSQKDIVRNCISYIKDTEIVNFNDKEIDKYYMQIKNVNKLRNLIAHHNGNLIKDKNKPIQNQKNYNLFKSDKRLLIVSNGQIYIADSDYIKTFIQNSEKFLKLIIEELKK